MRKTLASANRLDRRQRQDDFWRGRKKKFFLVIGVIFLLLQLLFLGTMAYLYGSVWKSTSRYHNFKVLYVDYDEGVVGQCVENAYQSLQGPGFPTLVQRDKALYPTMEHIIDAVKDSSFWAAFVTSANASDRIVSALQGGIMAQDYNPSSVLTYVWNEVRYSPFSDEIFEESFEDLVAATRLSYNTVNSTAALEMLNQSDPAAVQVLLNPIMARSINIMPTDQGTKLFYNTVSQAMTILQQFFFLLILNGLSHELQIYSRLPLWVSGLVRALLGVVFDFIAALCMAGYLWAYREAWDVTGKQFVLTWMVLWLLMHIHLLFIDAGTAVMPLPALPFFILAWIILNITSSISPIEINPSFYKWGYALPTNEAYTVLTDIWSSGSVPKLYRALPILFSWWIVCIGLATGGHFYRCHKAWKEDEKLESLEQKTLEEGGQETPANISPTASRRIPTEMLLQPLESYLSRYLLSVSFPAGLWSAFAIPDAVLDKSEEKDADSMKDADSTREGPLGLHRMSEDMDCSSIGDDEKV